MGGSFRTTLSTETEGTESVSVSSLGDRRPRSSPANRVGYQLTRVLRRRQRAVDVKATLNFTVRWELLPQRGESGTSQNDPSRALSDGPLYALASLKLYRYQHGLGNFTLEKFENIFPVHQCTKQTDNKLLKSRFDTPTIQMLICSPAFQKE